MDMQKLIERFAGVPSWIAAPCMALAMAQALQADDRGFVITQHANAGFVVTKTELPSFKPVTIPVVVKPAKPALKQFAVPPQSSCPVGSDCGQQRRGLFGRFR